MVSGIAEDLLLPPLDQLHGSAICGSVNMVCPPRFVVSSSILQLPLCGMVDKAWIFKAIAELALMASCNNSRTGEKNVVQRWRRSRNILHPVKLALVKTTKQSTMKRVWDVKARISRWQCSVAPHNVAVHLWRDTCRFARQCFIKAAIFEQPTAIQPSPTSHPRTHFTIQIQPSASCLPYQNV